MELDKTYEAVVEPAGRGITLVPCVFAWPRVDMLVQPGYQPTLAYGPRGVAKLWSSSSPAPNGTALEAALGTGRASVLKSLTPMPSTTTELAHQLRLSPAAVSAHLTRLKAAELVEPHRSGRNVYYRLSYAGESVPRAEGGELGARLAADGEAALAEARLVVEREYSITTRDRAVGARLGTNVARRQGAQAPPGRVRARFFGSAGQRVGAFLSAGVVLSLTGAAKT